LSRTHSIPRKLYLNSVYVCLISERAIHWTTSGIITAHPSKPILLLYPQPPSTSERKVFPSERRISEDAFGPARVLSVSESGEHVFAYFPLVNGSNSGSWCIWVNMLLRKCWTVEQGEAIIDCWWLGNPRQVSLFGCTETPWLIKLL
jgi:hypothetical protein